MKRRSLVLSAALALLLASASPGRALDMDHAEWLVLTGTGPIHGGLLSFVEFQPRFGNQDGQYDLRALIARGALGWEVRKGWTLWAGYGYTPVYDRDRREHRVFQQSTIDWTMGPFKLQNRTRLEQRFLEHEADVMWRLRSQLRLSYPLPGHEDWSLIAADEAFVNFDSASVGPQSGFDQNRLFLGVSHQLTPHVRVEVDYLNRFTVRGPNRSDAMDNGVVMQLALTW